MQSVLPLCCSLPLEMAIISERLSAGLSGFSVGLGLIRRLRKAISASPAAGGAIVTGRGRVRKARGSVICAGL